MNSFLLAHKSSWDHFQKFTDHAFTTEVTNENIDKENIDVNKSVKLEVEEEVDSKITEEVTEESKTIESSSKSTEPEKRDKLSPKPNGFGEDMKKSNLEIKSFPDSERSELLKIHDWLFYHVPISKNTDNIIKSLLDGKWTAQHYIKLTKLIYERAKFFGIWRTESDILPPETTDFSKILGHVVNLYKYRDMKALQLDQPVTSGLQTIPTDYRQIWQSIIFLEIFF